MVPSITTSAIFSGATWAAMNLDLDKQGTLYEQIARALKQAIVARRACGRQPTALDAIAGYCVAGLPQAGNRSLRITVRGAGRGGAHRIGNARRRHSSPRTRAAREVPRAKPSSRYVERARTLGPVTLDGSATRIRYNMQCGAPLVNPHLFNSWRRKLAAAALRAGPAYPDIGGLPAAAHGAGGLPGAAPRRHLRCERHHHRRWHAAGGGPDHARAHR